MVPAPATKPQNMLGISFMLASVLAGVATSLVVKTLTTELALLVLLSLRFIFGIPPLALAAWIMRRKEMFRINRWERMVMRIVIGHAGIVFWFLAVAHTSLGQATALSQSAAIFVTILSPIVLKERVGVYRGGAVMAGLLGIYLVTNPLAGGFSIGSVFALASAVVGALQVVVLRLLGRTEEPVTVTVWHNLAGVVIFPAAAIVMADTGLLARAFGEHFLLLVLLGIGGCIGQVGITSAYRHGEAAVLAPIRYISVPAAGILGWMIWDERLSGFEMGGMAIVVLSCVFISSREYWLSRKNRVVLTEHVEEHRHH